MSNAGPSRQVRVLVVTNVGPTIIRAYLGPLASLPEVEEVVVVRDQANVPPLRKIRLVTPPAWWPRGTVSKLPARGWLLRGEASNCPPDVVMTVHWFPDGPGAVRLAQRLGVPFIGNIVGSRAELICGGRRVALSALPSWVKSLAEEYQRAYLNQASALTFTGGATRAWFQAAEVRRPHLSVLHAAMASDRLRPGGGPRTLDIAFIGRLDPDKRIDRLLRVLAAIGRRRGGTAVALIGVSEDRVARLPEYAAARSALGEGLRLLEWVSDVGEVLRSAKLLLVTSDTEGRTLSVLEAMLCGTVPVVTDVGDLREALADGEAGILVPVKGGENTLVGCMADAACALLDEEPRRASLALRAEAHARREHDPRRTAEEWRSVLNAVGL